VHEHRKHAQHSCQQELRKLRGYQPSLRVFVSCHGLDNTPARGAVDSGALYPPNFLANALSLFGVCGNCPTASVQLYPSISHHHPLLPT